MRVTDIDAYQSWCAEVSRSAMGERFREILEGWATEAESLVETADWGADPIDAIRRTLGVIEDRYGLITVEQLGQLLVTLIAYWQHGNALAEDLSPIEIRVVQEVTARSLMEMAAVAADEEEEVDSGAK